MLSLLLLAGASTPQQDVIGNSMDSAGRVLPFRPEQDLVRMCVAPMRFRWHLRKEDGKDTTLLLSPVPNGRPQGIANCPPKYAITSLPFEFSTCENRFERLPPSAPIFVNTRKPIAIP